MNDLSKQLITIVTDYLGPAGERFLTRQVTAHLEGGITLETLAPEHIPELAKWIGISAALLLNDDAKVAELVGKIKGSV